MWAGVSHLRGCENWQGILAAWCHSRWSSTEWGLRNDSVAMNANAITRDAVLWYVRLSLASGDVANAAAWCKVGETVRHTVSTPGLFLLSSGKMSSHFCAFCSTRLRGDIIKHVGKYLHREFWNGEKKAIAIKLLHETSSRRHVSLYSLYGLGVFIRSCDPGGVRWRPITWALYFWRLRSRFKCLNFFFLSRSFAKITLTISNV